MSDEVEKVANIKINLIEVPRELQSPTTPGGIRPGVASAAGFSFARMFSRMNIFGRRLSQRIRPEVRQRVRTTSIDNMRRSSGIRSTPISRGDGINREGIMAGRSVRDPRDAQTLPPKPFSGSPSPTIRYESGGFSRRLPFDAQQRPAALTMERNYVPPLTERRIQPLAGTEATQSTRRGQITSERGQSTEQTRLSGSIQRQLREGGPQSASQISQKNINPKKIQRQIANIEAQDLPPNAQFRATRNELRREDAQSQINDWLRYGEHSR